MRYSSATALAAFVITSVPAAAHSWIDRLYVVQPSSDYIGNPGYMRAFVPREAPGFTDTSLVHILPKGPELEERDNTAGKANNQDYITRGITPQDNMCRKSQRGMKQAAGFDRLKASPGAMIALRYLENGHVTLPENPPGKPPRSGKVYIYGTSAQKDDEKFLDIFGKWNEAGTGGDKRGRLLATQFYDDLRCHQNNNSPISQERQKQWPHTPDKETGADLGCQNDIYLPKDLPVGKPYTVYWVWDWHTEPGKTEPNGKPEIYTSCMDIDIVASAPNTQTLKPRANDLNHKAVPEYMTQSAPAPAASAQPAPQAQSSSPPSNPPQAQGQSQTQQLSPPAQPAAPASPNAAPMDSAAISALRKQIVDEVMAQMKATPAQATMTASQGGQAPAATPAAAAQSPAAANASQMPTSLQLAAPMMSPSAQPAFSGTATPAAPGAGQSAGAPQKRCEGGCRKMKRSRIFGQMV